jgi:hypothetical protein
MDDALSVIGALSIFIMLFVAGRCSLDSEWDAACKQNRPRVIDKDVYVCARSSGRAE